MHRAHLEPVLDTLKYLKHETDVWFELTTLVIPGENDSDAEFDRMTRWVVEELGPDVPMHFSAFHPDWKMRDKPPTPPRTLTRAREIALANGIRYAYVGNVHDPAADSTYCHACGQMLIGRDWYQLSTWNLTGDGHCTSCGTPLRRRVRRPARHLGPQARPGAAGAGLTEEEAGTSTSFTAFALMKGRRRRRRIDSSRCRRQSALDRFGRLS